MTDEEYVRSILRTDYLGGGLSPIRIFGLDDGVKYFKDWSAAAEFTRQRLEQIRQREEDRAVLNFIILRTPTGTERNSLTNINFREQSALNELKRGMRQ